MTVVQKTKTKTNAKQTTTKTETETEIETEPTSDDIQVELHDYLSSKNISNLFVQIVEKLLIQKPHNPIAFMIEYLQKTYPEQAFEKLSKKNENNNNNDNKKGVTTTTTTTATAKGKTTVNDTTRINNDTTTTNNNNDNDNDNDIDIIDMDTDYASTSDDEDDYDDEMEIKLSNKRMKPRERRISVSAECADPVKANQKELIKIEKNEEEVKRIMTILQENPFFKHLDEEQKITVKDCMRCVKGKKDDIIIKQDDDGDHFYVVDTGTIDVFKKINDDNNYSSHSNSNRDNEEYIFNPDENKKIWNYDSGDCFGELAIMYNAPRAATCIATSETYILWSLDRYSFKSILMKAAISKRNLYKGFLSEVPILESLNDYEILTIADSLNEEKFQMNDIICSQGESGDKFYIIKSGLAICSKKNYKGNDIEVARLQKGMYFGEIALMSTKLRQATVTAGDNDMIVLSLDRKTFKRVMGPIVDVLKRNMELYNKVQAQSI